jgi:hypothetical protein
MKATLTTFTALTAVLAFTGVASAGTNLPMNQPNIAAPPPPMILPHIVRPDIVPGIDMSRLAKQKAPSSKKKKTKAAKSSPTRKTTRVRTDKAGRDERVRSKHVRSKPLIANPPLPRLRPDYAERLRGHADHLMLAQELARLGDLRERFGHNKAIDDASLGGSGGSGGSGRSGFDWQGLVPGPNTEDEGPQNDQIWRPERPGATAYSPGMEQTGGFTRPQFGQRDGGDKPGMSRTAGSARAGAGVPGRGGETSQDGARSQAMACESDCADRYYNEDGSGADRRTETQNEGTDQEEEVTVITEFDSDGNTTAEHTIDSQGRHQSSTRYNSNGDIVWSREHWYHPDGSRHSTGVRTVNGERRHYVIGRPDSQPVPDDASSGESMPCPKGSRGCGEPADEVPWQDKVAQPGAHGGDGVQTFSPSVAERKHAVTNPVPPDSYAARTSGGGRGPRPIEHVTGPGGDDPDTPPGR